MDSLFGPEGGRLSQLWEVGGWIWLIALGSRWFVRQGKLVVRAVRRAIWGVQPPPCQTRAFDFVPNLPWMFALLLLGISHRLGARTPTEVDLVTAICADLVPLLLLVSLFVVMVPHYTHRDRDRPSRIWLHRAGRAMNVVVTLAFADGICSLHLAPKLAETLLPSG